MLLHAMHSTYFSKLILNDGKFHPMSVVVQNLVHQSCLSRSQESSDHCHGDNRGLAVLPHGLRMVNLGHGVKKSPSLVVGFCGATEWILD